MIDKIKSLARFFSRAKLISDSEKSSFVDFVEKKTNYPDYGSWSHKPDRVPQLDLLDLKTIVWLVDNHGKRDIPIHSKRLMKKINESMSVYEREKELIKNHENNN